jgi:hypothetical protein
MGFASLYPSYALGKGYQSRINTILRRYYETHRKAG